VEVPKEIIEKLRSKGIKRVFVQFPEGLATRIQEITKELEEQGFEVFLCMEPTYGACDVRDVEAKRLGCGGILHIGHSDFGAKSEVPVVYWEYAIDAVPSAQLLEELKSFPYERVGLTTSVQYIKAFRAVKEYLQEIGKEVYVAKTLKHEGQVLGCNVSAAKAIEDEVDCILYVGAGKFHPLGIALKVKKPVYAMDLEKNSIYSLEEEVKKWSKIIEWNKSLLDEANRIGIIVSWKKGQLNVKLAKEIAKRLEERGKEVYFLAFDYVVPEKLEGLELDLLINFACPRIGIDDKKRFKVPIVNVEFLEI